MIIGIIGAMQLEIEEILNKLEDTSERITANNKYYLGKLHNVDVVITSCGVGKVNAASCTQVLISEYKVDYVINTGIAGSMDDKVKIGDVVISSDVVHHDVRPNQLIRFYPYEEIFKSDEGLIEIAVNAVDEYDLVGYHVGRIVSGEAFIESSSQKNKIKEVFKPLCVEMEGSAIGHVAYANDIPFLIIRSISDNADDEATINYNEFELRTAKQSAELLNIIIAKMHLILKK